jgi:hypothetical protein
MLEKVVSDCHVSREGRVMQWCPPVLVLGSWIRATIEKDAGDFHISPGRHHMQWSRLVKAPRIDIWGVFADKVLDNTV